jgi:hypothetical protein
MNIVIVFEILVGIAVLAAAVRFAMRDAQQRRGATESVDTAEALPARGGERETEQRPSEVVDQREGEEVAAMSAGSTAPEPSADQR